MITRDIFVALAVVVAKAPYILESDSSILVLLQARMIKSGKVSEFLGQIFYTAKHCIGFTLDFGFKRYRDLTNKRQNEPRNKIIRIPFESEKLCSLLYNGSKHATLEVSYKLLISFHMQKKQRLGLQRNQIFNQGIFFLEGGGGAGECKAIWRIVRTSEKILATPLIEYSFALDFGSQDERSM